MATEVQKKASGGTALATLRSMLEESMPKFAEVAHKHLKVERLVRLLLSAASRNPKILECSRESVLLFAMKCAETGLEPIGAGGAWPIPYTNNKNKTVELTFVADYRGLIHCARRSDCIKDAWAELVRENDEFGYELGVNPSLYHKPARGDRGALEAAYCVMVMTDGSRRFVVMERDDIYAIRDARSAAWGAWLKYKKEGPWNTDEGEMWKKTVVRRAMKPFQGASPSLTAIFADDDDREQRVTREPVAMPRAVGEVAEEANGEAITDARASDELLNMISDRLLDLNLAGDKARVKALCEEHGAADLKSLSEEQAKAMLDQLSVRHLKPEGV